MPNLIEQFFLDLDQELSELAKAYENANTPSQEAEPKQAEEPVAEPDVDSLDPRTLAQEAVRLLKKAENTDYVDEGEQLIRIADRFIRLSEIALAL
jgi:hypothetical protein